MSLSGHRFNQQTRWGAVAHRLARSRPTSLNSGSTDVFTPGTWVTSTPNSLYASVLRSNPAAGRPRLLRFLDAFRFRFRSPATASALDLHVVRRRLTASRFPDRSRRFVVDRSGRAGGTVEARTSPPVASCLPETSAWFPRWPGWVGRAVGLIPPDLARPLRWRLRWPARSSR